MRGELYLPLTLAQNCIFKVAFLSLAMSLCAEFSRKSRGGRRGEGGCHKWEPLVERE